MKILKKFGKRTWMMAVATVLVIAFVIVGVSSCSGRSLYQLALDNISEARFYMKQDQNQTARVQFFSGLREDPYVRNGVSERSTPFAVINVEPFAAAFDNLTEIEATLRINDENITIKLERNQFGKNFAYDIEKLVDVNATVTLTLPIANENIVFNLINVMPEDAISWERALEIAVDHLSSEIQAMGKFECYVKIISDLVQNTGSFWFVKFLPVNGDPIFVVMDHTGKILQNNPAQ